MPESIVNLSTVYGGLPLLERAAAARQDGFDYVESWWDFDSANPPADKLTDFTQSLQDAGTHLVAINSYGGDRLKGERGLAALPDRVDEFAQSIETLKAFALTTGARKFNVTFGNLSDEFPIEKQYEQAAENYRWAADALSDIGGVILIEPLSLRGNEYYPFRTASSVAEFLRKWLKDVPNVKVLFDTFHIAASGSNLKVEWSNTSDLVGHVQLADYPGRGPIGSGSIDFSALEQLMTSSGYESTVALEYFPIPEPIGSL